jgi:transcriptional regulator with XRE-family HTH domain
LRFYIIEVGKYLQKKRNGLGLKLKYFANQGISPSTISKIENGSPNVSEEMILKYARLLNVKEEELIQLSQTNVHTPDFWIDEIDFLYSFFFILYPDHYSPRYISACVEMKMETKNWKFFIVHLLILYSINSDNDHLIIIIIKKYKF